MKRHHDPDNSYKRHHLIEDVLQFQRFRLLSWWEALQHAGRPSARGAQSSTSLLAGNRRMCTHCVSLETSKPTLTVIYFLQHNHTYFNKTMPPSSATSYGPSIQTHESRVVYLFKLAHTVSPHPASSHFLSTSTSINFHPFSVSCQ